MNLNNFKEKKIIITGHTGFKGSWLSLWLQSLGAHVVGISDTNEISKPSHFDEAQMSNLVKSHFIDICEVDKVKKIFDLEEPDFVFHMAAQALVKTAYDNPLETIEKNAMGTASILESIRLYSDELVAVIITSDKVYDNVEWIWGYKEDDRIGGKDPYSASKGMAELAIKTYFESYLSYKPNVKIGIARAGNVIGGGDWANNRIVPDSVRAWSKKDTVILRNPNATRPWQHVLEPLSGYLNLALSLSQDTQVNGEAFNFGPSSDSNYSVLSLIEEMSRHWSDVEWKIIQNKKQVHEAGLLKLNCDKAQAVLNWRPALSFEETIKLTVDWYKRFYELEDKTSILEFSMDQINEYTTLAKSRKIEWAIK